MGRSVGVLSYPIYGIDGESPKKETTARQSEIEKTAPKVTFTIKQSHFRLDVRTGRTFKLEIRTRRFRELFILKEIS